MQGQSSSVKTGVEALPKDLGGVVFQLVDQPYTSPELIQRLRKAHATGWSPIIFPSVDGIRANPVLFDRSVFEDLTSLTGDAGGRTLFDVYETRSVPWEDDRIQLDIDTPEDYQALQSQWD
jgi:molybdenum cofactor cytidylyltransferase